MQAPAFSLQDQDGKTVTLTSLLKENKGKRLVLYFYPKADTPGCTTQACGLRDNIGELKAAGVVVVGVSPDEPAALKAFQQKYDLNYTLLGDPSKETLRAYKVWGEKQFMGRTYLGVLRTTFLIDENGAIVKRYDNVKPETHADMIIADVHGTKTSPSGAIVLRDLHIAKKAARPPKKAVKKPVAKTAKRTVKKIAKKTVKKAVKRTAAQGTHSVPARGSSASAAKKKK